MTVLLHPQNGSKYSSLDLSISSWDGISTPRTHPLWPPGFCWPDAFGAGVLRRGRTQPRRLPVRDVKQEEWRLWTARDARVLATDALSCVWITCWQNKPASFHRHRLVRPPLGLARPGPLTSLFPASILSSSSGIAPCSAGGSCTGLQSTAGDCGGRSDGRGALCWSWAARALGGVSLNNVVSC